MADGVEQLATSWAITHAQPQHLEQVRAQLVPLIDKTRAAVRQRLVQQINYLDAEAARLRDTQSTGRPGRSRKNRQSPERLEARARDLEARLDRRTAQLDAEAQLAASPPTVVGAALVIPAGLIPGDSRHPRPRNSTCRAARRRRGSGRRTGPRPQTRGNAAQQHRLRHPLHHTDGQSVFIEVKGRIPGAEDVTVTLNEVLLGKNVPAAHRLALVEVSPDGPENDELRYVCEHFRSINLGDLAATDVRLNWAKTWAKGTDPC